MARVGWAGCGVARRVRAPPRMHCITDLDNLRSCGHAIRTKRIKHWRPKVFLRIARMCETEHLRRATSCAMWEFYLAHRRNGLPPAQAMMVFRMQLNQTSRTCSPHPRLHRARGEHGCREARARPP